MKTEALKQALDKHKFDAAFGGARRDEEKVPRQGARLLASATRTTAWDPKNQRPSCGTCTTAVSTRVRVDPGLPAVELDRAGRLAVHPPGADPDPVPLYFAAKRPVVENQTAC